MPGQSIRRDVNREGRRPLTPLHSIVNDFVGLSCRNPVAFYTFPYDESREATPVDPECAARQMGITSRYRANLDVPPHNHEFYEITVVREGTAVHHTDTADTEVGPGSVIVVPPGMVHAFTELRGLVVTNIYYQSEWLSEELRLLLKQEGLMALFLAADLFGHPGFKRIYLFRIEDEALDACLGELRDFIRAINRPSPQTRLANLCFLKFLCILSVAYCTYNDSIGVLPFRPETWAVLEEMEDALLGGRSFSLSTTARRLGLSTRHLSLIFLRDVGLRPTAYFLRRRGQHGARLLLRPNATITDVALHLGYADTAHFSNQFRKLYGLSPTEYRERFNR